MWSSYLSEIFSQTISLAANIADHQGDVEALTPSSPTFLSWQLEGNKGVRESWSGPPHPPAPPADRRRADPHGCGLRSDRAAQGLATYARVYGVRKDASRGSCHSLAASPRWRSVPISGFGFIFIIVLIARGTRGSTVKGTVSFVRGWEGWWWPRDLLAGSLFYREIIFI